MRVILAFCAMWMIKQDSESGNAPACKLFDPVKAERKPDVVMPSSDDEVHSDTTRLGQVGSRGLL